MNDKQNVINIVMIDQKLLFSDCALNTAQSAYCLPEAEITARIECIMDDETRSQPIKKLPIRHT